MAVLVNEIRKLTSYITQLPEIIAVAVVIEQEKAEHLKLVGKRYSDEYQIKGSKLNRPAIEILSSEQE